MAGETTLASLVILTDSVRVLQEHVNTGHVFKTANLEQYPICDSNNGKEKLSPVEDVSKNPELVGFLKLSPDKCVFGNSESCELNNEVTKDQLFLSDQTVSVMKLERIAEESNSSEASENEHAFGNEQEAASIEESFVSFCSNKTMPLKTYSKWQVRNRDKHFDRLKLVFSKESITETPHLNEGKSDAPKDCSSSSQISDSENKLCFPIKKSKGNLKQRNTLTEKTIGKENLETSAKSFGGTTISCTELAHELESENNISLRKGFRVQKREPINSRNKRSSHSKKVEVKRELYKCVACGKIMRNITCVSKYVFRNCSAAKSRKCQKCLMEKVRSRKKFSQK